MWIEKHVALSDSSLGKREAMDVVDRLPYCGTRVVFE